MFFVVGFYCADQTGSPLKPGLSVICQLRDLVMPTSQYPQGACGRKLLGELMGGPDSEKSGLVIQAMLKMKKIIVANLQKAYGAE